MKDSVLILGAGSSASYGFPTGEDLKWLLISKDVDDFCFKSGKKKEDKDYYLNFQGVALYFSYLKKITYDSGENAIIHFDYNGEEIHITAKELNNFRKALNESSSNTIDTFISQKNDESAKKIANVLVLLAIRAFSTFIFNANSSDDWFQYFAARNFDWIDDFTNAFPTIITFNYDNVFYLKLEKYFQNRFPTKYKSILNSINIIHVYGNIRTVDYGDLPGAADQKDEFIRNFIKENYTRLKFIRKIKDDSDNIQIDKIRQAIKVSKEIYVLGYGFDRFNNEILFENEINFKKIIKEKFQSVSGFNQPDYITYYIKSEKFGTIRQAQGSRVVEKVFDNFGFMDLDGKCRTSLVRSMPVQMFP
jgi:hypothetical protein